MNSPKNLRKKQLWKIVAVVLLAFPVHAGVSQQALVQKFSIATNDPFQLKVQTSAPVTPHAEIIADPERLVIDIPNAAPAAGLRDQSINRNEVNRLRVGLLSSEPPVTRIVLDLNSPQWYRIEPAASGFTVRLGANSQSAQEGATVAPTIGWVSAKGLTTTGSNQADPFVVKKPVPGAIVSNGVHVKFSNGLLEIHARNTTLSEVLFQIQKQTGAEIAIPAGTEQEHVIADFGPAPASEVLAQLLNGTDLNFVVVGSEADPKILRSVVLSRKTVGYAENTPSYTPPVADTAPTATNIPQGDTPDLDPQPEQNIEPQPPQEQVPSGEAPPS